VALLLVGIALALALVWRSGRHAYELGRASAHAAPAAATMPPAAP
jgi:hypothetical protein